VRLRHATTLFLLLAAPSYAASPTPIAVDKVADAYVRPHQRIEVERGRRMNLYCDGNGSPTVVFDAGLSDWSVTWALIQPAVATRTRACSYDRPGMGYSDPATRASTPVNAVQDLAMLLKRAGIKGPLLLVGHSLGGFHMKLYATLHPDQVAGVVLVDPSEERLWDRVGPPLTARFGEALVREAALDDRTSFDEVVAHFKDCAQIANAGQLDDAAYAKCTDPVRPPLGPVILAERHRLQSTVAYQNAQAAEAASSVFVADAEADARYARVFGAPHPLRDKPLVVLTHSLWDMTPPYGEIGYVSWVTAHQQTAALSTKGSQRMVPLSRHNIQIDRPQEVTDAIVEVLDAIKAR
jgi:pimeloyl-ACP methyl ester carboxylesterase